MRLSIKALRVDKGATQAEMAAAVGVNRKTVQMWESGKSIPNADKIEPICTFLGVPYDRIRWNV